LQRGLFTSQAFAEDSECFLGKDILQYFHKIISFLTGQALTLLIIAEDSGGVLGMSFYFRHPF
jgi:hypothetical protein